MEGFGVVLGVVIGIFLFTWLKVKIFGDSSKDEDTSISAPARASSRDSDYVANALWQNFYDSGKALLFAFGIMDDRIISRFCNSEENFATNNAAIEFISLNERKSPPTSEVFVEAVRGNYELLSKELQKRHIPCSIEVEKHFNEILDRCTTLHTYSFFRINQVLSFTGMVSRGIVSLNYFMYAYHFYLQAITQSPGFMSRMSDSMHEALTGIGRDNSVLLDDQTWTDGLEWGKLMCNILDLTITPDDLLDVTRIFDKLDAKDGE